MPDIITIKETVTSIAQLYGVKRLYLFGSYAKGTANEKLNSKNYRSLSE